jgi:2-C-methyl-D-erythritol 4-phosphate cytidylyltransferase/2-C-methyl-D-erythritol 2,4-cyclodiphosphate synthase
MGEAARVNRHGESGPRVAVVIVAAGSGTRLGAGVPKAFVTAGGRALLEHAVRGVAGMAEPAQLVVVAPAERATQAHAIVSQMFPDAVVVAGGTSRQASVEAGLAVLATTVEIVLVHDAARAFTSAAQFDAVVSAVAATGEGAVPGLPVADTVKRADADSLITATVDRSELVAVQTPQGFRRDVLLAAYARAAAEETDDAALVTAIGEAVRIVPGDPLAFKVTTTADLHRAEQLLAEQLSAEQLSAERPPSGGAAVPRIGIGTDTHAFGGDGELWLAGLCWPGEPALAGHSDGDAVVHAIVDAMLSAAGLGDIGGAFGTADPRFAGAHGEVFLRAALGLVADAGYRIGNVSVQLVGNRPRFSARRGEAERLLTGVLGAPVSISATTTDGLGFTGRGEGVTAIATAIVLSL